MTPPLLSAPAPQTRQRSKNVISFKDVHKIQKKKPVGQISEVTVPPCALPVTVFLTLNGLHVLCQSSYKHVSIKTVPNPIFHSQTSTARECCRESMYSCMYRPRLTQRSLGAVHILHSYPSRALTWKWNTTRRRKQHACIVEQEEQMVA